MPYNDGIMDTNAFTEAYGRLNPGQKKAVDTIEGPVMVIAGPGTGKTTVLTLRIANILRQTDTPASAILAITYTDAGVKAMRTKLKQFIGNRAHEVRIHTFHGFAAAMIAEYPDHFTQLSKFRQITDIEQESLVRELLREPKFAAIRPLGRPDAYLSGIIRTMSAARRDALTPDDVRVYAEGEAARIKNDESSISTRGASKGNLKADALEQIAKCERTVLFAELYTAYEGAKRERGLLDFDDLIIELLVALQKDELFKRLLQERFLYILVDEHQDTNDAQNLIVRLVASFFEEPNVFIVGDEKQAIYRFQGASVGNFLALKKLWQNMTLISLDTNYRSHQHVLDASFSMIEQNYDGDEHLDLRVKLRSGRDETPQPLELVNAGNVAAMEAHLIHEVKRLRTEKPQASIAVIVRRNRELERVLALFERAGVSVSSERSVDIFAHPMGRVFFDLVEYCADPSRTDALARAMVAGCFGLSLVAAAELLRELKSGQLDHIETKLPGLRDIHRARTKDSPLGFLITLCQASGFADLISRDPTGVQVWRGIMTLAESIVRDRSVADPSLLMEALLAYRLSAEQKTVKVTVGAPDSAVTAMTVHGSKGLEFDYVFIPYATEEAWVGTARGDSFVLPARQASYSEVRDLRRLFYVALTRAREHVILLTPKEDMDGKVQTPLRFLAEIDTTFLSTADIPRVELEIPVKEASVGADMVTAQAMTDLAKRKLMTTGISVSALNRFLEDPYDFLYQSVLQMPQAPSVVAEKGSAMHAAMDRVWQSGEKEPGAIETMIKDAVDEYLRDSLLGLADKELVRQELHKNAALVSLALQSHFALQGTVLTEHWVEGIFETQFQGQSLEIPVRGKLDAIIDSGSEVEVFDYKTMQSMTEAAIRGETKSSSGDYFRQLAFYTLLLSLDPRFKGKRIRASLVFVAPDKKGACPTVTLPVSDADLLKLREEIESLIEFVWSGKLGTLVS